MTAHTGFLVFCRQQERSEDFESRRPLGTRERKQEAARLARLGLAAPGAPDTADGANGVEADKAGTDGDEA